MKKIEIGVPEYDRKRGLVIVWEEDPIIRTRVELATIVISANQDGLVSLARQLLTLSQIEVLPGTHIHYDPGGPLEEGSVELIIEKIE